MQNKYLGEFEVDISASPFSEFKKEDWAMHFIGRYGQIDGDHHKAWVLDQVSRILKNTPVVVKLAKWSDGTKEYRITTGEASKEYKAWVKSLRGPYNKEEECYEYGYEKGIAP